MFEVIWGKNPQYPSPRGVPFVPGGQFQLYYLSFSCTSAILYICHPSVLLLCLILALKLFPSSLMPHLPVRQQFLYVQLIPKSNT